MLLRTPNQTPLVIAAGRYKQTAQLLLSGVIDESADLSLEMDQWVRLMRACLKRFGPELCDGTTAPLSL